MPSGDHPSSLEDRAFWLLVVIIVSIRIVYYPAPAFEVGAATDVKHAATR